MISYKELADFYELTFGLNIEFYIFTSFRFSNYTIVISSTIIDISIYKLAFLDKV